MKPEPASPIPSPPPWGYLVRPGQSMASAASVRHLSKAQVVNSSPVGPVYQGVMAFLRRSSSGSMPRSLATSSMWTSWAKWTWQAE